MTWALRPEELSAVLELPAPERYRYFVKRCADWEQIWSLRDDRGWVTAEDGEGKLFVPVWPHPEYARRCALGEWRTATPTATELQEWLDASLPELERERYLLSVFPVPAGSGIAVDPARLRRDLEAEQAVYE